MKYHLCQRLMAQILGTNEFENLRENEGDKLRERPIYTVLNQSIVELAFTRESIFLLWIIGHDNGILSQN